ncbi:amino acid ABC transporter ATP-binding protein [Stomatohabitans albus]|uniref:amino acid ABC transporter ATP-binding protein n=1 Tax=Stomatohabitans albus TaxID=3110766 RepID=UPI00300D7866
MSAPQTGPLATTGQCLEVDQLVKTFDHHTVLNGITLAIEQHQVLTLIGPSGSGKSTLLRCVNLLEKPDAGSITFQGECVTTDWVDVNRVRRRMGMVFQSWNLFGHLNILDNVTLGARKAHKMPRDEAESKAMTLLSRVGLADKATEWPDRISGGQAQRVAICRALITDPELLLLDEVTSALDPELVGEVLGVIRELAEDGMTMMLATHEMGFARDVSDQVAFLHDGKVLEQTTPDVIFTEPTHERTRQFLGRLIEARRI